MGELKRDMSKTWTCRQNVSKELQNMDAFPARMPTIGVGARRPITRELAALKND